MLSAIHEQLQHQFDERAESYEHVYSDRPCANLWHHEKQQRAAWTLEWLTRRNVLPLGARILDAGCGDGFLLRSLSERIPAAEMIGVDISKEMISRARTQTIRCAFKLRGPRTLPSFVVGEASTITGTFDAIVSLGVVGYQRHPVEYVARLAERLRPQGHLIITIGNRWSLPRLIRTWGGAVKRYWEQSRTVIYRPQSIRSVAMRLAPLECRLATQRSLAFGLGIRPSLREVNRSAYYEERSAELNRRSRFFAQTHWLVWRKN